MNFNFKDGKGDYLGLFKAIRFRLNKRPLTESEQTTVDKFHKNHGKAMGYDEKESKTITVEEEVLRKREEKGNKKVVEDREKIKELLDF